MTAKLYRPRTAKEPAPTEQVEPETGDDQAPPVVPETPPSAIDAPAGDANADDTPAGNAEADDADGDHADDADGTDAAAPAPAPAEPVAQ